VVARMHPGTEYDGDMAVVDGIAVLPSRHIRSS
jgi:hypothetical protein